MFGDEPRLVGEILRDLRRAEAAGWQSLDLGEAEGPEELRLWVAEEKLEVTMLDAISLEVGGQHLPPRSCLLDATLAHCTADGRYQVLRAGEGLELVFDVPNRGARALHAHGYYVPTPTRPW